jgi:hypothetical protein
LALALSATWAGCGGAGLVPVEGTVTLDGQPLATATVRLTRNEGPINERMFMGETDAAGHFRIATVDGSSEGAPAGDYRVSISTVKMPPGADEMTKLPPERVPQRWRSGAEAFQVPPEGTTEADFAMKSR